MSVKLRTEDDLTDFFMTVTTSSVYSVQGFLH